MIRPPHKKSYTIFQGLLNEKCGECAKAKKKIPFDLK
jgi:hypothetical protein